VIEFAIAAACLGKSSAARGYAAERPICSARRLGETARRDGQARRPGDVRGAALEPRITLITLGVSDLDRSIQFYRDGLKLPKRDGPEGIAFFETAGTWLSLYRRESLAEDATVAPEGSGFRGFTLSHNVASPDDVDRVLREAVEGGATLVKPGQKVFWGGYSGYFADPDGFLWEVAWNPHFNVE
jgi:catechol 2,3-dioxygenase-like lactoylglutathione lyase family enzyme